ncbi:MAG: o-succinylbenzoate synthase [Acidimicrobiia bacterium]
MSGLRVHAIERRRVALPLVTPFRTSFGTQHDRDILLVRVETGAGEGWGECVALTEPVYSAEYVDGAQQVLRDHLAPRVFAAGPLDGAGDLARVLAPVHGHPMAKAALELALLDAELRAVDVTLAARLGGIRERVACGVSIGMFPLPELLDQVDGYLARGYRRVKLKIEPGFDIEPVRAVRERHPDLALQVDANTAYTVHDAARLAALDPFDLLLIEQPLPEDDLLGHAEVARRVRTPICLDESITSARVARQAIELGACSIVNIKAGRVGGYLEAVRVHDVCVARGIPVWCGGMLETGIGRAANVALAALPGFTLPGDTSASDRYYARDVLTTPFTLDGGCLTVPTGPGLGVTVDVAHVAELTTHLEVVRP